jgi:hypothetical protein
MLRINIWFFKSIFGYTKYTMSSHSSSSIKLPEILNQPIAPNAIKQRVAVEKIKQYASTLSQLGTKRSNAKSVQEVVALTEEVSSIKADMDAEEALLKRLMRNSATVKRSRAKKKPGAETSEQPNPSSSSSSHPPYYYDRARTYPPMKRF